MIPSIQIKNYRNLKDFKIKEFGMVNLITGKNNTGKSSILEALWLVNSGATLIQNMFQILEDRGENITNGADVALSSIASLFSGRNVTFDNNFISISYTYSDETQLFQLEKVLILRLVWFVEERVENLDSTFRIARKIIDGNNKEIVPKSQIGLEIKFDEEKSFLSLKDFRYRSFKRIIRDDYSKILFIKTQNAENSNSYFWDKIALTEKEIFVIKALQIIEPQIERVAFVDESKTGRNAVVKLQDSSTIIPLRSMGDGINRILTIILALVNAENGYLLIDEFENGLHHSVQNKLWEIVFFLSDKLNIQIFATTHSNDCVAGFEEILNKADNQTTGRFIRLENKNGEIREIDFDKKELKIAVETGIEIR